MAEEEEVAEVVEVVVGEVGEVVEEELQQETLLVSADHVMLLNQKQLLGSVSAKVLCQ